MPDNDPILIQQREAIATPEEARANIKPDSVAQGFLNGYFTGEYRFPF